MYSQASSCQPNTLKPPSRIVFVSLVVASFSLTAGTVRAGHVVESPDGKVVVTFDFAD